MVEPLVDSDDVETALVRPLTATEAKYIDGLMAQSEALLRTAWPTIDDRVALWGEIPQDPSAIDPAAVRTVLAGVIKRYLVNVDGAATKSESAGPFAHTTSFASYGKNLSGGVQGVLIITPEDLKALTRHSFASVGSIRLRAALAPGRLERGLRR